MTRRRRVLQVLVVSAALAAGCGGDSETDTASAPEATPTEAAATAKETGASDGGKITPLGTTLEVGEPAIIDYQDATTRAKSIIELTPKSIEKGSLDDFENIDLDEQQKASTPFYAEIAVKNIGKGDLTGGDPATYINGVDDRGQDQNEIIFIGGFERCDRETPKQLKPGDAYEACLVYLIPGGGSLEGFRWIQFDEKTGKSNLEWR